MDILKKAKLPIHLLDTVINLMNKLKIAFFVIILSFSTYMVKADDQLSFSIGQFDINDTIDSAEMRLEYLYGQNFYNNNFDLKPFVGAMFNSDSGKYIYSGLRKDYIISSKWNFTPSFAAGYYDRGSSKDLGHNIEFRSQLEFSYQTANGRVGFNVNHISNASIGNKNPGTESATISFIRPF